ncbi:helix-turn-helix domain-containing protein [Flavobacterium sp. '19STA2R22 D10 B1']|uniref:helix-turn-helix domain-containing protein n=1 Tax=Flavobacterium aerium TaxID=3037261 RepID=UPI00278C4B8F|nr:helix-turn-helix domain-containing protein [Flavobacterium sp. '19STA2R22 D10 B1']
MGILEKHISVPKKFEDVFSHIYYTENNTDQTLDKKLVPDLQAIIAFSLGNNINLSINETEVLAVDKYLILGPIRQTLSYQLQPGSILLVINFKWDAFYRFFGHSLASYTEFIKDPDQLINDTCFTDLCIQIKKMGTLTEKIDCILDFCEPYLRDRTPGSIPLMNQQENNISSIKSIAAEKGYSERTVQLNHKKYFGYTAKEHARYQRFKKVIDLITTLQKTNQEIDWLDIVTTCNYYDQSHLIHDFNHYLQLSPNQYLKLQEQLCVTKLP